MLVALATVAAVLALVAWLLPDRTEISVPVAPGSAASLSTTLPTLPRP